MAPPEASIAGLDGNAVRTTPTLAAMRPSVAASGLAGVGLVMSGIELKRNISDIEENLEGGNYKLAAINTAVAGLNTANVYAAGAATLQAFAPKLVQETPFLLKAAKGTPVMTLLTGGFQIAMEEEGYKEERALAVGGSVLAVGAGWLLGLSAAPLTVVGGGSAIILGDAADAHKAGDYFEKTIAKQEGVQLNQQRAGTAEISGGPSLLKYDNLRAFTVIDMTHLNTSGNFEIENPDGSTSASTQDRYRLIQTYKYSEDPVALQRLGDSLRSTINGYNKIIKDNTSWYGTSGAIEGLAGGWATNWLTGASEEIDDRRRAQMSRARYEAADRELKAYLEEIAYHKEQNPRTLIKETSGAPSILNYDHLRAFATLRMGNQSPDGQTTTNTLTEQRRLVEEYAYSQDPAALDRLEKVLTEKIKVCDELIPYLNPSTHTLYNAAMFNRLNELIEKKEKAPAAVVEREFLGPVQEELKQYREDLAQYHATQKLTDTAQPVSNTWDQTTVEKLYDPATLAAIDAQSAFGNAAAQPSTAPAEPDQKPAIGPSINSTV